MTRAGSSVTVREYIVEVLTCLTLRQQISERRKTSDCRLSCVNHSLGRVGLKVASLPKAGDKSQENQRKTDTEGVIALR